VDVLTNHARVFLAIAIAVDPTARLRGITATCRITERTAQAIVADLEQAGYLSRERIGLDQPGQPTARMRHRF
jgi:DNA-binding MarR family transcriptional regulator